MCKDLDFSIRKDILTISSKMGIPLKAIFHPSQEKSDRDKLHFCADKNDLPICDTDFLISNVKKRQDANKNDSLKGHYKNPQIPFINLFVSTPNGKHRPVMHRAMHDSGCAKSVIHKDIFESIPGYKDIPVNQLKTFL
jgi:hypothetical protein